MFRPLPVLTAATVLALAVLIGLGIWQLQRRDEKHALLAQIATREQTPPAPIEIVLAAGDAFSAHRHVTALGTFDHAKEAYVYAPRTGGGPQQGKKVVTPFNLTAGGTILVDRGWVDDFWPNRGKSLPEPEGEVEVEGILRPASKPGTFTPPPDIGKRMFYLRDSAGIGKLAAINLKSQLILEATTRLGNPEPLKTELNIPDNHLSYAITWFSLGVALVVIYFRLHYLRGRLRFSR